MTLAHYTLRMGGLQYLSSISAGVPYLTCESRPCRLFLLFFLPYLTTLPSTSWLPSYCHILLCAFRFISSPLQLCDSSCSFWSRLSRTPAVRPSLRALTLSLWHSILTQARLFPRPVRLSSCLAHVVSHVPILSVPVQPLCTLSSLLLMHSIENSGAAPWPQPNTVYYMPWISFFNSDDSLETLLL